MKFCYDFEKAEQVARFIGEKLRSLEGNPDTDLNFHHLNVLCVFRLVECMAHASNVSCCAMFLEPFEENMVRAVLGCDYQVPCDRAYLSNYDERYVIEAINQILWFRDEPVVLYYLGKD